MQGKVSLLLRYVTDERISASGRLMRIDVTQMTQRMKKTRHFVQTKVDRGLQIAKKVNQVIYLNGICGVYKSMQQISYYCFKSLSIFRAHPCTFVTVIGHSSERKHRDRHCNGLITRISETDVKSKIILSNGLLNQTESLLELSVIK